jgi:hypothetical protein
MATTVERRRPSLSNKPALGGRSGYEAGDARIPITARSHPRLTTPGRIHSRRRRKGQPTSSLQNGGGPYIPFGFGRSMQAAILSPQSRPGSGHAPRGSAATSRDCRTRPTTRSLVPSDLGASGPQRHPMRRADAFLRRYASPLRRDAWSPLPVVEESVARPSRFPSLSRGISSYHSDEPIATFLRASLRTLGTARTVRGIGTPKSVMSKRSAGRRAGDDRLLILMPDLALWLPALVGR